MGGKKKVWLVYDVSDVGGNGRGGRKGVYLCVVLRYRSVFMSSDDISRKITPRRNRSFRLIARNRQRPLIALLSLHINLNIQHDNRPQKPHPLFRHGEQFRAILVKLDPLNRGVEIPYFHAFAGAHVPEADGVVCGAGGEERG